VLKELIKAVENGLRRIPHDLIHGSHRICIELGDCTLRDGLLYVKDKVYIPSSGHIRTKVIKQSY